MFIEFLCANIKPIVSSFGLLLDMIGVVFVFKFGVPNKIDGSKIPFIHADDSITEIGSDHGKKVYWGILLLLLGFSLQIISNWL